MPISNLSNGLRTGVCTSTNRPTTPYEGQVIYETDTDKVFVWNASAWKQVPTAATAGAVLQVVASSYNTELISATSTYATTGLTASITPQYNTSKILVLATIVGAGKDSSDTTLGLKLFRGATEISFFESRAGHTNSAGSSFIGSCSTYILDAPATTSATTYTVQYASVANTSRVIIQQNNTRSTMILQEISA